MKIKKLIIPLILFCIFILFAVGCSNTKSVEFITDIAGYEDMRSGGDKIEVDFENRTKHGYIFTIEDKGEIDEIVNLVLTTRLNNAGDSLVAPGDNTHFAVYQGNKVYGIALSGIMSNNDRYVFASNGLREKIGEIAVANGALDIEIGVIYKVIDISGIESVKEEKIAVADRTALENLIKNDFADCEYFYIFDKVSEAERFYTKGITANGAGANQYAATVTAGQGKLVLMWHIYQNFGGGSYYLTKPSMSEINLGTSTAFEELEFGLWHSSGLKITFVS